LPGKCRNGVVVAFVTSAFFLGEWRTANLLHVLYIGRFRKVSRKKSFLDITWNGAKMELEWPCVSI